MRLLITGQSGFVGSHLTREAIACGVSVVGIDRVPPREMAGGRFQQGDATDRAFMARVLADARPTHVVHLAAVIPGPAVEYAAFYEVNVVGTARLFDSIVEARLDPVVLINSSSAVYGNGRGAPIRESDPLAPLTHYAVSKIGQEMVARHYHLAHGVRTVVARTFNLIGPGQPSSLVGSAVAEQIARAEEAGIPGVVRVGDLTPRRDFVDVRDAVRAYLAIAGSGQPGETYNVCSGEAHAIAECVEILRRLARVPIAVEEEPSRRRRVDVDAQVGDDRRVRETTGWRPAIPLADSLRDLLEYWRHHRRTVEV